MQQWPCCRRQGIGSEASQRRGSSESSREGQGRTARRFGSRGTRHFGEVAWEKTNHQGHQPSTSQGEPQKRHRWECLCPTDVGKSSISCPKPSWFSGHV